MRPLKTLLESLEVTSGHIPEDLMILGPAKLSEATEHHLGFLANMKYEQELYTTKAAAVLVPRDFVPRKAVAILMIPVDDPYATITRILEVWDQRPAPSGISELAFVSESAEIGKDVYIGDFAYVGPNVKLGRRVQIHPQVYVGENVSIGKDTILYPGVKVYYGCEIRENCIIHAGAVIGSDGFGYAPNPDRTMRKVPQIGNVIVKREAEIGANCTIDRATMGSTVIGVGAKLDNLVMVGHNVEVGNHSVIAAQSGISGSTKLGKYCMVGGQVGFAGHLTIASGTKINAKSGVGKSVKEKDSKINGIPAFNFMDSLRSESVYRKLPELEKKIKELEEILSLLRK